MNLQELIASRTVHIQHQLPDPSYEVGKVYKLGERYKIKRTQLFLKVQDMQKGEVRVKRMTPKIPKQVYNRVKHFFKSVWQSERTESSCMLFYGRLPKEIPEAYKEEVRQFSHRVGQWLIYVPKQQNTPVLTDFRADTLHEWLRQQTTLVAECHSHHSMSAFWSSTDNQHQKEFIYYIVCGGFTDTGGREEVKMKYVQDGHLINVQPKDLIAHYTEESDMNLTLSRPPKYQKAWIARAKGLF